MPTQPTDSLKFLFKNTFLAINPLPDPRSYTRSLQDTRTKQQKSTIISTKQSKNLKNRKFTTLWSQQDRKKTMWTIDFQKNTSFVISETGNHGAYWRNIWKNNNSIAISRNRKRNAPFDNIIWSNKERKTLGKSGLWAQTAPSVPIIAAALRWLPSTSYINWSSM